MDEVLWVRVLTTGAVVILISWSVGALGPVIGGALAGLPMVMGPGFFFLMSNAPEQFVATAATFALLSLCATQSFLLSYMAAARYFRPLTSLLAGLAAWCLTAMLCYRMPSSIGLGLGMFTLFTTAAIHFSRPWCSNAKKVQARTAWWNLLLRGLLAGILVAIVTLTARRLGASLAGMLMSFPIGYTVISLTIHEHFGKTSVITTLHSALLGSISLAMFCTVIAATALYLPPLWSLASATLAALAVTCGLLLSHSRK